VLFLGRSDLDLNFPKQQGVEEPLHPAEGLAAEGSCPLLKSGQLADWRQAQHTLSTGGKQGICKKLRGLSPRGGVTPSE